MRSAIRHRAEASQPDPPASPARAARRLRLGRAAEVAGQEGFSCREELQPVLGPGEAVALVRKQQVLDRLARLPQRLDDLLRLGLFHARVVRALRDQERALNL